MLRKVEQIIPSFDINMGGIMLKQALPTNNVPQFDPFLLLHHGNFKYTSRKPAMQQGIGPHPHRGFSPVTFVINGEINHRDSRGNNQVAMKGEVQWMNAGLGIVHSERPSDAIAAVNGATEIIQLWINSPATNKSKEPSYQHSHEKDIPHFFSDDKLVRSKVITGEYNAVKGAMNGDSELLIIWSNAQKEGVQKLVIEEKFNLMIYVINGDICISGHGIVDPKSLILFENNAKEIKITANSTVEYLILGGVPIKEKMVQHGPFVMNTEAEIMEAMRDYQIGKMGVLIED
ncbi:MAG TPA: pirin family protein [Crocinitomicaceae bacterium]|nr:pirin family protein [Crocinitomicaceae bacterium]